MLQTEKVKEITEQLEDGIRGVFESENYKSYLKTLSRFTSYSLNNILLIAMQRPEATLVAGYGKWKGMGRFVCKGAKAIKIIAPCIYKKKEDESAENDSGEGKMEQSEAREIRGFKIANVFDISDTDGKPLPELVRPLVDTVNGYVEFIEALKQFSPVPIEFQNIKGAANGYYHLTEKRIVIDTDMEQSMSCKTGIHEIAHALLHDKDTGTEKDKLPDRNTKEVQAESVAYTVCQYFNIDSSNYSFGYIAGWSKGKELEELKQSMETIRGTSEKMIKGIEEILKEIRSERYNDQYSSAK